MRLLLDTCVFLWLATEPSKLSVAATVALDDDVLDPCFDGEWGSQ